MSDMPAVKPRGTIPGAWVVVVDGVETEQTWSERMALENVVRVYSRQVAKCSQAQLREVEEQLDEIRARPAWLTTETDLYQLAVAGRLVEIQRSYYWTVRGRSCPITTRAAKAVITPL